MGKREGLDSSRRDSISGNHFSGAGLEGGVPRGRLCTLLPGWSTCIIVDLAEAAALTGTGRMRSRFPARSAMCR